MLKSLIEKYFKANALIKALHNDPKEENCLNQLFVCNRLKCLLYLDGLFL